MRSWQEKLQNSARLHHQVCIGLDPDLDKIPSCLGSGAAALQIFNEQIIDACAQHVMGFKFQMAHYAAQSLEMQLEQSMEYIRSRYPNLSLILDGKRGDIGSTAEMYAREAFERYGADAVTLNPYMGWDSIQPFAERADKGLFILCRTSNPSAGSLQNLNVEGTPLYQVVAKKSVQEWGKKRNIGLVVGATAPEELKQVVQIAEGRPILVPGIGFQGGSIRQCIEIGGRQLILNSSRAVIYASSKEDFALQASEAVQEMNSHILACYL